MTELENYQYSIVEKISFNRFGGTEDELRAANILLKEIQSLGGEAEFMEFSIPACTTIQCSMTQLSPAAREITCAPYWYSGSLPEGGRDLKLVYADCGAPEDYLGIKDLSDCVVLINELSDDSYKLLLEKKPAAFMTFTGKYFDTPDSLDLHPVELRPNLQEMGKIPGFIVRACDALKLAAAENVTLHLDLIQEECEHTSRNILAVIPGTEIPDESIVITGHYDSVLVGTGSWDNATGAAALMFIYRQFLNHPSKRTLRFIWCGSEEQGLRGSRAYVTQKEDLVSQIKMCFNFDMNGTVLGPNKLMITGGDDLKHLAEQFAHEVGFSNELRVGVHSSDSAPFATKGIPAIGIGRGAQGGEIHTHNDIITPLRAKQM